MTGWKWTSLRPVVSKLCSEEPQGSVGAKVGLGRVEQGSRERAHIEALGPYPSFNEYNPAIVHSL